jgi:carbon-monoxide dehydrogenase large subunit
MIEALGTFDPPFLGRLPDGRLNKFATYGNAAHIATCLVDPETGTVALQEYVAVHDSGRVVHRTYADGQIMGGIAQGIGGALLEQLVYEPGGQLLTGSFLDYAIPRAADVPPIRIAHPLDAARRD